MPTKAPSRPGRVPQPPAKAVATKLILLTVAAVVVLFAAGLLGWVLKTVSLSQDTARISATFTAKITSMIPAQTGGCATPLNGSPKVCSRFIVVPDAGGTRALRQGEVVRVAHEWVNSQGRWSDLLLIYRQ